ncbi:MAG: HAD family hydrolase [Longibaculum sp.]
MESKWNFKVLDYYNISIDETMAFGDGHNDIDMFELAKIAVAMECFSGSQRCNDEITNDIDDDGFIIV